MVASSNSEESAIGTRRHAPLVGTLALMAGALACTLLTSPGEDAPATAAPEAATHIEHFLGLSIDGHLSTAALETLAIIAYRQPVTRAEIEAVRGVDCGGVLRTLIHRGFTHQVGRLEQAGRPIIYGTTFQFLRYFGLESLDDLPALPQGESVTQ